MKTYNVCLPLTGTIWVTVEAESEEAAIEAALCSEDAKTENIEEWQTHRQICKGNVLYADTNEAYAEEA
jgi:hypothetical protein